MSDTPRTDAAWNRAHTDDIEAGWLFANQLERELNEANADRRRLRQALTQAGAGQFLDTISATPPPPVVAKADADAVADACKLCSEIIGPLSAEFPEGWAAIDDINKAWNAAQSALETYRTKYP
jgi:hypothetical protein